MPAQLPLTFAHRHNRDRSFDSICLRCFRTAATRQSEAELAVEERRHVCRIEDVRYVRDESPLQNDRSTAPRERVHRLLLGRSSAAPAAPLTLEDPSCTEN